MDAESNARSRRSTLHASPASQRPTRTTDGDAGKPSPESADSMPPPPPPKRVASTGAQAMLAAARKKPSDIGRKLQAATGAPPPPPPPIRSLKPSIRPPSCGERHQAAATAAWQLAAAPKSVLRAVGAAISPEMSRDASPVRTAPDLMGNAAAAAGAIDSYRSPHTVPRAPPAEPTATRSSGTLKDSTVTELAQRLELAGPTTRAQERVSKAEQRAWAAEQKRESRARAKHHEESCAQVIMGIGCVHMIEYGHRACAYD